MPIYFYVVIHEETGLSKSFSNKDMAKEWICHVHKEHDIPSSEFYIRAMSKEEFITMKQIRKTGNIFFSI